MFTREQASRLRQEFWTAFGKYMSPVPAAEGTKVNWVNYRTGIKHIYFRMDAGQRSAAIAISIEHADPLLQQLYFDKLLEMKTLLHAALGETWDWHLHVTADGKISSRIEKQLPGVSVLDKPSWADLISFFKPRIIALDAFWSDARYVLEGL